MRIDEALGIEPAELVDALGEPIPVGRHRCATLPLDALRRAFGASPVRPTTDRQVVAIVLAAGSARRFGGEKVTAPILGVPVVRRAVLALTGACDRVLVVAAPRNSEEVRRALADLPVEVSFVLSEEEAALFLDLLQAEDVDLFYVKFPVEYGFLPA